MYASGDYQFARRWFAGARYDRSERAIDAVADGQGPSFAPDLLAERVQPGSRPVPAHAYAEGVTPNELLFQFLFSIGAHGAHVLS